MTDTLERIRHKIDGARQLGSVVHAMKALATLSIGQYESAVRSLEDYLHTLELGLSVCLRNNPLVPELLSRPTSLAVVAFGSDQGLVGRFNESLAEYARSRPAGGRGATRSWIVGERLAEEFAERGGASNIRVLAVPTSVAAITPLVNELLVEIEESRVAEARFELHVLFNSVTGNATYAPVCERLLPLDAKWQRRFARLSWPTRNIPQLLGPIETTLRAYISEYLFVSLFRACAESLSSENASRLVAMQRAERNIDSLIGELTQMFNGLRQSAIDEELFDVIAGFDALRTSRFRPHGALDRQHVSGMGEIGPIA